MKCEEIFCYHSSSVLNKNTQKKFSCVIFYLFDEVFVLDHYFISSVCSCLPIHRCLLDFNVYHIVLFSILILLSHKNVGQHIFLTYFFFLFVPFFINETHTHSGMGCTSHTGCSSILVSPNGLRLTCEYVSGYCGDDR